MNGYIVGAIVLFCVSSLLVLGAMSSGRRRKQLYLTEGTTTSTLTALHAAATQAAGPNTFSQPVDLAGAASAGPGGSLTATLTGRSCVWHHNRVIRRVTETVDGKEQTRVETVSELRTETPFLVRDHEGSVLVVPTTAVDGAEKLLDEGVGDLHRVEWVLTEGTQVYVNGLASDRDGQLAIRAPEGKQRLVISTRTEKQLLEGARRSSKGFFVAAGCVDALAFVLLVVGLTR